MKEPVCGSQLKFPFIYLFYYYKGDDPVNIPYYLFMVCGQAPCSDDFQNMPGNEKLLILFCLCFCARVVSKSACGMYRAGLVCIHKDIIKEVNKILFNFIWKGKD